MKPNTLIIFAGLSPKIGQNFVSRFNARYHHVQVTSAPLLDYDASYSKDYVARLYHRLVDSLIKKFQNEDNTKFEIVLMYVKKGDGSESNIIEKFGVEMLIIPIKLETLKIATRNQRDEVTNLLVNRAHRAFNRASRILPVISEEVTNRDNKTCLLLPIRNFGDDTSLICKAIHDGVVNEDTAHAFRDRIRRLGQRLPRHRVSNKWFFQGRNRIIFRSPGKARHGMAPSLADPEHEASCAVRGRFRFGAYFDPCFHYDCDIPPRRKISFYQCHGDNVEWTKRSHVNIAPNDNVRQ